MATINIADYQRPGIFINEIDKSIRQVPAQTEIVNLVPGFSKKGPVNRPVLITTPQELYEIFGNIDRTLEKKGSFFHRTILNIIQSGPVWALNLLKTDDQLDTLEWASVAVASDKTNEINKTAPYSRFFDKSDFWYRDTDAFLAAAKSDLNDENQIMHVTNMSDRKVSVFFWKSEVSGYNESLENWYGGRANVPAYLNPNDLASDYLVSMLIVSGDWSDYQALSVDNRWAQYFNNSGLRKDQVQNFINDPAITILEYYADLSLIPFFKAEPDNENARDVFIETVVNRDTDRTGIFMAFDVDALEDSDFNKGLLDLIGSNLVDSNTDTINYLSYYENIKEAVIFNEAELDRSGNAFGHFGLNMETKTEGSISVSAVPGIGSTDLTLDVNLLDSYIINGLKVVPTADGDANKVVSNNVSIGKIRKDTLYLDNDGVLGIATGIEVSNQTLWDDVPLAPISAGLLPIAIAWVGSQGTNGDLDVSTIQPLPDLDVELSTGTNSGDILITYNGSNDITFTFVGTRNVDPNTNYRKTKLDQVFNQLQSSVRSGVSVIKDVNNANVVINDFDFVTDTTENKSLQILVSPSIDINNGATPEIFFENDEQTFSPSTGSESFGLKTETSPTSEYGVIAKESELYASYVDGRVNSGDFFYPNLFDYSFGKVDFYRNNGNDFISLYFDSGTFPVNFLQNKLQNRQLRIVGTEANDKIFNVLTVTSDETVSGGTYDRKVDVIVNELVTSESLNNASVTVHGANDTDKTYLKFYLIGNNLTVEYTHDPNLSDTTSLQFGNANNDTSDYNLDQIIIFSNRNDYKQSVEIEGVVAINKVLVNAERYSEVRIGDYLQAFVDENQLEAGEEPKRLTRIVNKRLSPNDPTLVELTTDRQIDIIYFGSDAQTLRYTSVERYVNTYQSIVLNGFKMRQDSIPDGTESRQNSILNVLARNTPIFKGLVNRNKISWRYLVDPWSNGLTANSKQQLVDLCGERLTALGLLNMPSAKSFKNSTATNFVDSDGALSTEFIRLGGDPESSPSFLYSFGQGDGQSNTSYFFPHVTINDNGRPLLMPPASYVLNTFMRKHTSRLASVKPWTVAAGLTNGLVTGFGNTEMDLNNDDIVNLNQMNANPLVYKVNRGFVIETDNTAQVSPRSALSITHVREVLIELEEELYQMLLTYQWRSNTEDIRSEIKSRADAICERFVRERGLSAFLNVMDTTNNTGEVIDAQIGVIDTYVEPVKAMGTIVNNITILRTGQIQSGGFRDVNQ